MDTMTIPCGGIENLKGATDLVALLETRGNGDTLPFDYRVCNGEAEWLEARRGHIGASSAGCVLGLTEQWKSRKDFWLECRGEKTDDFKGNALTEFGHKGEVLIRAMYALEHPNFTIYDPTNMHFVNKARPWQSCSLDMVIVDPIGKIYIGEIKTAIYHKDAWKDFAPAHYEAQIAHELAVTGFDGAMLIGRMRFADMPLDKSGWEKTYFYDAADTEVRKNIAYVTEQEARFWESVESGNFKPTLNLEF